MKLQRPSSTTVQGASPQLCTSPSSSTATSDYGLDQYLDVMMSQMQQTSQSAFCGHETSNMFFEPLSIFDSQNPMTLENFTSWNDGYEMISATPSPLDPPTHSMSNDSEERRQPSNKVQLLPSPPSLQPRDGDNVGAGSSPNYNDPAVVRLEKRRHQNRVSQRSYRARKEARLHDATGQVEDLRAQVETLQVQNDKLKRLNRELERQILDSRAAFQ